MSDNLKIKINTRRFTVKKNENYSVPSKGLIRSWRMVDKNSKFIPILYINNRAVVTPRSDIRVVSIPEIRNYIRNMECTGEERQVELDAFEQLFYSYQLYGIEYYPSLSNKELFDSLFTRDIKRLQLSFGKNGPDEVEIEEEFWDRKVVDDITQTEEDIELQKEISTLKPLDHKVVSLIN